MIKVIKPGSPVKIGNNIEAIITAVCIRGENEITYECVWWNGAIRHCEWIQKIDILKEWEPLKIGFGG